MTWRPRRTRYVLLNRYDLAIYRSNTANAFLVQHSHRTALRDKLPDLLLLAGLLMALRAQLEKKLFPDG